MVDWAFESRKKNTIRDKLIIELLFRCGSRSNELINLKIEDIRGNNFVDIEKPKGGDKRKRIVLIDDDLKSWTSTYIRQNGREKGHLFRSNLKKRISNRSIRDIIKIIGRSIFGLDLHSHPSQLFYRIFPQQYLQSLQSKAIPRALYYQERRALQKYTVEDIRNFSRS